MEYRLPKIIWKENEMIDIKALEKNIEVPGRDLGYLDAYKEDLKNRGGDPSVVDQILQVNKKRKVLIADVEVAKAEQNKVGQQIAILKKNKEDATVPLQEMQKLSADIKERDKTLSEVEEELTNLLLGVPNHCHHSVNIGHSEEDNKIVRVEGEPPKKNFNALDHVDIGEKLGIIDFERAAKVAGARFAFLKGAGSALERALIQFMLDTHTREAGYTEMIPPFIVNSMSLKGTGQFPKFKEDVFSLQGHDFYLIPTAEVPVTNYYAGELIDEKEMPISYAAFSPCFRSEAGSYGRDTRGLTRQHQFNKVELLKFVHPETSYEEHEKLTRDAERILKYLELPYRVSSLCTGDIGFSAAKCYDLEVWMPGQDTYREISSCSNFEDFQARRANIRFRPSGKGKPQFVHTLNGSGLAVGRTLIAILENYQQEDGSVRIPQVLQKYMFGEEVIR